MRFLVPDIASIVVLDRRGSTRALKCICWQMWIQSSRHSCWRKKLKVSWTDQTAYVIPCVRCPRIAQKRLLLQSDGNLYSTTSWQDLQATQLINESRQRQCVIVATFYLTELSQGLKTPDRVDSEQSSHTLQCLASQWEDYFLYDPSQDSFQPD